MTLAVAPKIISPPPLRKTIKKPATGGILKKKSKKRKITTSKQKAVVSTADNTLKLWHLEKKLDMTPLCKIGTEKWKKKK